MDIREHLVGQLSQQPYPHVVYIMTEDDKGKNVLRFKVTELDECWKAYEGYEYVGKTAPSADNSVIHIRKV